MGYDWEQYSDLPGHVMEDIQIFMSSLILENYLFFCPFLSLPFSDLMNFWGLETLAMESLSHVFKQIFSLNL